MHGVLSVDWLGNGEGGGLSCLHDDPALEGWAARDGWMAG